MKKIIQVFTCFLLLQLSVSILPAQTISLDAAFGKKGIRKMTFKKGFSPAKGFYQANGNIIVAGSLGNKRRNEKGNPETDFALVRFLPNGKLDKTFGVKGKVIQDINNQVDEVHSAAVQADGKILVVGNTGSKGGQAFILLRYEANGNPDLDFGEGGKRITKIGEGENTGTQILLLPNGQLLLVGHLYDGYDEDFVLIRYTSDGNLDPSFGNGGHVLTDFDGENDDAIVAKLLQDGRILVAGAHEKIGRSKDLILACYHPDGTLDNNFGTNGLVKTRNPVQSEYPLAIIEQAGGELMIVGRTVSKRDFVTGLGFYRYEKNGKFDPGKGGRILKYKSGTQSVFPRGAIAHEGQIFVGGGVRKGEEKTVTGLNFAIAKFDAAGKKEVGFNGTGLVISKTDKKSSIITNVLPIKEDQLVVLGVSGKKSKKSKKNKLILARYQL